MSLTRNKMMVAGGAEAATGCPITYPIDNSVLIAGTASGSDGYFSRSPSQNGDRKTWTFSAWLKRDQIANYQHIFNAGINSSNYETLLWYPNSLTSGAFHYQYFISNNQNGYAASEMVFRDPAAWYHIVFVRDSTQSTAADRLRLYVNGVRQNFMSSGTYAYQTLGQNNEGYVNSTSYNNYVGSAVYVQATGHGIGYIAENHFVDGQGLTADDFGVTDTCSGQWVAKEYTGTYGTNGFYLPFESGPSWSYHFDGDGDYVTVPSTSGAPFDFGNSAYTIEGWFYTTRSSAFQGYFGISQGGNVNQKINFFQETNGTFNVDSGGTTRITTSAIDTLDKWVHFALVREGTGTNQLKFYADGVLVGTGTDSANYTSFTSNFILGHNGELWPNAAAAFQGWISNFRVVKGSALYTSAFTPSTSPLTAISGTTYLTAQGSTFVDNSSLGQTVTVVGDAYTDKISPFYLDYHQDHSGNSNDFTAHNLTSDNQTLDTPTNNFQVINRISPKASNASTTISEGNLKFTHSAGSANQNTGTFAPTTSLDWYFEALLVSLPSSGTTQYSYAGFSNAYLATDGKIFINDSNVTTVSALSNGDIVSYAAGASGIEIFVNGSSVYSTVTTLAYAGVILNTFNSGVWVLNFGQNSSFAGEKTAQGNGGVGEDFYYAPPTGYKALCTKNLPDPEIAKSTEHFNTVLWTGDATSSRDIAGLNFSPDFVWTKERDVAIDHLLYDTIRGASTSVTSKAMASNTTAAEGTQNDDTQFGFISAFNSDGFSVTNGARADVSYVNKSGGTYVAWNWKAGGTASSNTDGTITSTVSANTTAGFSIVSYTSPGTSADETVGHGLSQTPELVIIKNRDSTFNWDVWNTELSSGHDLILNQSVAQASGRWSTTIPTASLVTLKDNYEVNGTDKYIAYCFHSVDGYSKVGSYTGNGSTDGTFFYTGFRPAFIMFKNKAEIGNWMMLDNKRNTYNVMDKVLWADLSTAEGTYTWGDFTSNGFKLRTSSDGYNNSGQDYIYLAIAESPFKYSNAR